MGEAIAAYRKAIELDPKNGLPYNNLGNALRAEGKLDEAIAAHRRAIEFDPKDATGGYPLALRDLYLWMIQNQDLKPQGKKKA